MNKLFAAVLFALALVAPGCSLFQPAPIPVSEKLSPMAQDAQKSLNEANLALTAAANVIAQDVTEGIILKAEAQEYITEIKALAKRVSATQALLDAGDILTAKNQAAQLQQLVLVLHRRVAATARKGTTP
jgi:soluble cytochrome b562